MKIFHTLAELADYGPTIATIGNFDGVHRGHCWVIAEVIARARTLNQRSLAITFDPHPARVLRPEAPPALITPLSRKLELLAATGIDATLVLPFDDTFSRLSARTFADTVLKQAARATEVHEGENFRFGYQAESGIDGLQQLGAEFDFKVRVFAPQILRQQVVSSSRIRKLIAAGEVASVRALLGRPFSIDSTPAPGRGYGTRFTVPTINLAPYPELLPANGVYVTTLQVGTELFEAVTNIGNRPTFGADSFTVESHLLNFHPIALDEATPLRLTFLKRLRPEIRWPNPEALKAQIGLDVAQAKRLFHLCKLITTA
ncbi:riboflavin biosynthesis protein RibF [Granulicella arctica]|uniref:riboflavin biosynthesis protein RibF n=1 Tax=Granulicella arctica TaxID=940613 RepID=UPI0021DF6AF9|nr:riboflavin biosynthesis protein RibF [Granulicella arctica]